MRVAHLADLHLGFRQFDRSARGGRNQREADVALALTRVVDDVLVTQPELLVIAGDIFHQVRPPNGAICALSTGLRRIRAGLPNTPIVVVAGNHDTPRSSETESILPLYLALGVDVALVAVARVQLPGVTVTAVPSSAAHPPLPVPDPDAALNVLLIHGDVPGFGAPQGDLEPEAFESWNYAALGHYHVAAQVGPRAWYAGAIDYTSSNVWSEVRTQAAAGVAGKGYLLIDLEPGREPHVEFRLIASPRRFLDLEPIDAQGLGASEIDAAIAARTASEALDDAVARLVITNISRLTQRALDQAALRALKGRALHFQLDCRRPEEITTAAARRGRGQSLEQLVDGFLEGRELPPDVDRAELRRLGAAYMASEPTNPYTGERWDAPAASAALDQVAQRAGAR